MTGKGKGKSKAKIDVNKPELPPFLQRMKMQIVENEAADIREMGAKRRKERADRGANKNDDGEDGDPTIVKLNDDDLTEEEYKRMKLELDTYCKADSEAKPKETFRLDIDEMMMNSTKTDKKHDDKTSELKQIQGPSSSPINKKSSASSSKKLSYQQSSSESDSDS